MEVATPKSSGPKPGGLSLKEKLNKKYSFSKESVRQIFELMMKAGFQLREPKKPQEVNMVDEPDYCQFHRCLGHTIEDCVVFKDIIEKKYRLGEISLSRKFLLPEASIHMITITRADHERTPTDQEGVQADIKGEASSQSKKKASKFKLHAKQKAGMAYISKGKEAVRVVPPKLSGAEPTESTLGDRLSKKYSFSQESIRGIFGLMMGAGFQLREPKKLHETHLVDDPNYCHFHRCLGHTLENCFVFKDIVEKKYQSREISLSKKYLLPEPSVHATKVARVDSTGISESEGGWKAAPLRETEGTLLNSPVHVPDSIGQVHPSTHKHNQLLQIMQQDQEEIMRLETGNKKLEELVCELLGENVKLKREVRSLKEAFRLLSMEKTDRAVDTRVSPVTTSSRSTQTDHDVQYHSSSMPANEESVIQGLFDATRNSSLLEKALSKK